MRIENWGIICTNHDQYLAPELHRYSLVGEVYGHSKHEDGEKIQTSTIRGKRKGLVITESDSEYELGEPNDSYEEKYPNSKNRLIISLQEV